MHPVRTFLQTLLCSFGLCRKTCSCVVFIIDAHDGAAALWYVLQRFVMAALLAYLGFHLKTISAPYFPQI